MLKMMRWRMSRKKLMKKMMSKLYLVINPSGLSLVASMSEVTYVLAKLVVGAGRWFCSALDL